MTATMDGLKPGRIVYLVLSAAMAAEIMRRRTTAQAIAERISQHVPIVDGPMSVTGTVPAWPLGAQAHIGNPVREGDIVPAMVVRTWPGIADCNLKANLDGSDSYWATSVPFDDSKAPGSWHWMFDGQQKRYDPTTVKA